MIFTGIAILGKDGLWQQMHSFPGAPLRPALSIGFAGAPIQIVTFIYLNLLTPVVIHPLLFTYRIT